VLLRYIGLHGIISQKIELFIITAVRTSNSMCYIFAKTSLHVVLRTLLSDLSTDIGIRGPNPWVQT
jgi:hypothetical protein